MGMINEFKKFAMRGSVIDLAVGIIIGAAFGKITTSLVEDIIMPPIGLLLGEVDFNELKIVLREKVPADVAAGAEAIPAVTINYGSFINTLVNFLIIAFAVFLLIKSINKTREAMEDPNQPDPVTTTKSCQHCCSSIPLKASRCPQCTSELEPASPPTA